MNPIKALPPTYEPETESRESLNHRLALANKDVISLTTQVVDLRIKLGIEKRNINIIENSYYHLNRQADNLRKLNKELVNRLNELEKR